MSENPFCLGLEPETGAYLEGPSSLAAIGQALSGDTSAARPFAAAGAKGRENEEAAFLPMYGVDVGDLASTGWGVIFAQDTPPAVRDALRPLLDHRRKSAAGLLAEGYRELEHRAGETKADLLSRYGAGGSGSVDPAELPYYLLLVGSPAQIPFSVQYELALDYAVGRLWLDSPEEYAGYAETVLKAEAGQAAPRRRAIFFGPVHPGDKATELSAGFLGRELVAKLAEDRRAQWSLETVLGDAATKTCLAALLGGAGPPAFLMTAGHGVSPSNSNPRQRDIQGALVCREWPGPGSAVSPQHWFAAADLDPAADLAGLVAFHFACFSGGTPSQDDFFGLAPGKYLAPEEAFLARLPQRLLGRPGGRGAQAVIAHVDRAWKASFLYREEPPGADLRAFQSAVAMILDGLPVGHAMHPFTLRHAALAAQVTNRLADRNGGRSADAAEIGALWLASHDARNYLVLGDPAVRLASPVSP
jgi:hypothetical protein